MDPMTMMAVGSAVASGLSSIFGGQAASAAAKQRNEQAYRNWIQSNTNKTFANSREQFQAAYNFAQQLKRNSAIAESAYRTQFESTQSLKDITTFQQMQLSKQQTQASASLLNALSGKNISSSSGLYSSLAIAQTLDALNNSNQLKKNYQVELDNINRQFTSQMSQQTENIFMPNLEGYDQGPLFEDTDSYATAGLITGAVQIGSAFAATGFGKGPQTTPSTTTSTTTSSWNSSNNAYTNRTSGGSVGGR